MLTDDVLRELLQRGVQLWTDGGELRYRAPGGAIDSALRPHVVAAKQELIAAIGDAIVAPASAAQKRFWFIQQLDPRANGYNVPIPLRLRGPLDVERLAAAWDAVVRRHESLRTSLRTAAGLIHQFIARTSAGPLPVIEVASEEARDRWMLEAIEEPFRSGEPLVSAALLRLADDEHTFWLRCHHAMVDATAIILLLRDLGEAYRASEAFEAQPVRQYRDYVAAESQRLTPDYEREAAEFWRDYLAGAPAQTPLPFDFPRPEASSGRGRVAPCRLSGETSAAVREFCRAHGMTPFTFGLAATAAFLCRLTGADDLVLGTPFDTRSSIADESMAGCCTNTLLLRTSHRGGESFLDIARRAHADLLRAIHYAGFPFDRIARQTRSAGAPLFQTLFHAPATLHTRDFGEGIVADMLAIDFVPAHVELTCSLIEDGAVFRGEVVSDIDLFAPETVSMLANSLTAFIESALATPAAPLETLALLAPGAAAVELQRGTPAHTHPQEGADALTRFEQAAIATPDAIAVQSPVESLTYRELDERSTRLAAHLASHGLGAGRYGGILLERGCNMVAAMLAIWKTGAAYVPLDPAHPADRIAFVCEDVPLTILLTSSTMREKSDGCGTPVVELDRLDLPAATPPAIERIATRDAYVIYTSGSTGRPKGVAVTHDALRNLIAWHQRAYAIDANDRGSQIAGPAFDAAVWEIWPYLSRGASVHFPSEEERHAAESLLRWMREERITVAFVPTPLIPPLLAEPELEQCPLKALLTGGEQLKQRPPRTLPFPLVNHYGPTENTVVATAGVVEPEEIAGEVLPSIGRPIDGVTVLILDDRMRPVPPGAPGELSIGGMSIARGYVNRPELTAERFVANPFRENERLYRTGDRARFRADGSIEFLGRSDDQVKIRGYRIEPGEIEAAIQRRPEVAEAVVVVAEPRPGEKRLVAHVVPARDANARAEEIRASLRATLPEYMVPHVIVRERLPLTPNGKVDRRALAESSDVPRETEFDPPRTIKEEKLAEIWSELLGVTPIGRNDDFFELGGHSLLVMQLSARIRYMFDVDLPPSTLYTTSRLADLAEVIRKKQQSPLLEAAGEAGRRDDNIIPLQPRGAKPPLFVIHAAGGHLLEYRALGRELARYEQPLFGIESPGLHADVVPAADLESLAASYLEAIRRVHDGAFRAGGYCIGGLIAFEMARQAREAGTPLDSLIIFDTRVEPVLSSDDWEAEAAALFAGELKTLIAAETLQPLDSDGKRALVWRELAAQWPEEAERLGAMTFGRLYRTYLNNLRVAHHYTPRRYDGELHVFEPIARQDKASGWIPLTGQVSRYFIPGKHITFMRDPHAAVLARSLDEALQSAPAQRPARPIAT